MQARIDDGRLILGYASGGVLGIPDRGALHEGMLDPEEDRPSAEQEGKHGNDAKRPGVRGVRVRLRVFSVEPGLHWIRHNTMASGDR